jgi:hypothetical protein
VATAGVGTGGEPVRAQDESAHRRMIFVAIVSALAVALAIVAFIFHRRSRKAQAIEERALARHAERVREVEERREARREKHAQEQRAHDESVDRARRAKAEEAAAMRTPTDVPLLCATCRREFPPIERGGGAYCPYDATRLSPASEAGQSPRGGGSLCPTCQRGYAAGVKTCPVDGDELIPVAMALSRPTAAVAAVIQARGKICPTCGGRFDGAATFCGKDGTALVLLN